MLREPLGAVLLERRPARGVWGGLWCFPEMDPAGEIAVELARLRVDMPLDTRPLAPLAHTFTHFRLRIEPVLIELPARPGEVAEDAGRCWYSPGDSTRIGLSAPVTRLLATLETLRREA